MNTFTRTFHAEGFTDTLVFEGTVYMKRYKKDPFGWTGLDIAWEFELLPDTLISALEENDELEIMNALAGIQA